MVGKKEKESKLDELMEEESIHHETRMCADSKAMFGEKAEPIIEKENPISAQINNSDEKRIESLPTSDSSQTSKRECKTC
jgi:hypothetical protein